MNSKIYFLLFTFLLTNIVSAKSFDPSKVSQDDFTTSKEKPSLKKTLQAFSEYKKVLDDVKLSKTQKENITNAAKALMDLDSSIPKNLIVSKKFTLAPTKPPSFAKVAEAELKKSSFNFSDEIADISYENQNQCGFLKDHYEGDEYIDLFENLTEYHDNNDVLSDTDGDYEPSVTYKRLWWNKILDSNGKLVGYAAFPVFKISGYPLMPGDAELEPQLIPGHGYLEMVSRNDCQYSPGAFLFKTKFSIKDIPTSAHTYLEAKGLRSVEYPASN